MKGRLFALVLALCVSMTGLPVTARAESILPEFLQKQTQGRYPVCAEIVSGEDRGTVELFANSADEGDTVYLRAVPGEGCLVEIEGAPELEYMGLDIYAIVMPAEALTLRVRFCPAGGPDYPITVSDAAGGTLTLCQTSAREGERIVIEAAPAAGYGLKKVHVTDGSGNRVRCIRLGEFDGIQVCEVTMPAGELSVRAEFEELVPGTITCSVTPAGGGKVLLSHTAACPGEIVRARVHTGAGFAVDSIYCSSGEVEWGPGDTFTFRMPEGPVEIWVELRRRTVPMDGGLWERLAPEGGFGPRGICRDGKEA